MKYTTRPIAWPPRIAALLILLHGLSLPLTASALESEVHVYGTLLPFAENTGTSGPTAPGLSPAAGGATQVPGSAYTGIALPNRLRMTSGTSNLGFKGSLQLSERLRVIWQVESAVSLDGDGPNTLAGRNTGVGLAGSFGTVFYGSWDTPYKYPNLFIGPVRGLNPFDDNIAGNPGFNVPATTTQTGRSSARADAAFSRRQGNSVQYWTPVLYGLSGRVAYSFAEGTTPSTATAPSIAPDLFSALLTYERGPFGIRYGYELHRDYFGLAQLGGSPGGTLTNPSSSDSGQEIVAWFALPTGTKLTAVYERLAYDTREKTAGAVDHYGRDAWFALAQQRFGDHQLWVSYGQATAGSCTVAGGGPCTANGLGATQLAAGYVYSLGANADVYAAYYQLANERSASYAAFPPMGTVAPGATTRGFGLGFLYTFDASWKFPL
jgi:predicted porin